MRGKKMIAVIDGVVMLIAEDKTVNAPLEGGIGFAASTGCFRPCHAVIRDL